MLMGEVPLHGGVLRRARPARWEGETAACEMGWWIAVCWSTAVVILFGRCGPEAGLSVLRRVRSLSG